MQAVVGSRNPVKIAAARAVLRRVLGDEVEIRSLAVDSGVSDQPWGNEETLHGARNRAEAVLSSKGVDLGVGLEAGLLEVGGDIFTCAWCVVAREDEKSGIAGGANLLLPLAVAKRVRAGAELGPTMDTLTGLEDTKRNEGAIGILTAGYLDRQSSYEHILTLALARLLTPQYYDEEMEPSNG